MAARPVVVPHASLQVLKREMVLLKRELAELKALIAEATKRSKNAP